MLSGLFWPRREISSLKRGYTRPGEKAPGASVLSGVFSPRREIFRPSEKVFSPGREYFRSGENRPCSLDYFRPSDKFFIQERGIFARAKLVLPKLKKKNFFWLFVSECLALLECNVCI